MGIIGVYEKFKGREKSKVQSSIWSSGGSEPCSNRTSLYRMIYECEHRVSRVFPKVCVLKVWSRTLPILLLFILEIRNRFQLFRTEDRKQKRLHKIPRFEFPPFLCPYIVVTEISPWSTSVSEKSISSAAPSQTLSFCFPS